MLLANLQPVLRSAGFVLILFLLSGASAEAQYEIVNNTKYDLWLAKGTTVDHSISGIGGSGWVDPDAHITATGWFRIPAKGTLSQGKYSVRDVISIYAFGPNERRKLIRPQSGKPNKIYPRTFPFSEKTFNAKVFFNRGAHKPMHLSLIHI